MENIPSSVLLGIDYYRKALKEEMIKFEGNEQDFNLIKDETLRNAIKRNRNPEDVVWALLQ